MKRLILLAMVVMAIMLWGNVAMAQAANGCIAIAWDPLTPPITITGYKVYVGTSTGNYGTPTTLNFPTINEYIITTLNRGTVYYIAITDFDSGGESYKSNEVNGPAKLCGPANLRLK